MNNFSKILEYLHYYPEMKNLITTLSAWSQIVCRNACASAFECLQFIV